MHPLLSPALLLSTLLLAGCASNGVRRLDPSLPALLEKKPRVGLASARFAGLGAGLGSVFGLSSTGKATARTEERCLAAVEEVLAQAEELTWAPRESLAPAPGGEEAEVCRLNELAATVSLTAVFGVLPGFAKRLSLDVDWVVVAPDGRELAAISTAVAADERVGPTPDRLDPRFQPIWADLARRSALDFLALLAGRRPSYER